MNKPHVYTNLDGQPVTVPCLDWLEDGTSDEGEPCSRYYIGEEDGDSQSVWLDDDLNEVNA